MRTVYRMMAKKMLRTAFTVTQNTADAEDVLQDSLLKLYQARDTYRPTGHPQAYVLTVVRHTALDLVRNRQKTVTEDLSAVENTLEAPPDGSEYQFFNYNRLCWKKDAVIEEIRRKNLSYVFAWDPLTGDILYQCSAPGCFVPRSRIYDDYPGDVLRINENGEIVWTVYSIVGIEPVGLAVSSMREWVTSAVYEVTITGDGAILPRFIGGTITNE